MRIGKPRNIENRSVLYDLVSENSDGYYYSLEIPDDCSVFIQDQFKRFNIELPDWKPYLISLAAETVFSYVDIINPYALLLGFSDVTMTNDWAKYVYEISSSKTFYDTPTELNPEDMETFKFVPGQCEHWFEYFISHPGLEAIPHDLGTELSEQVGMAIEDLEWRVEDEIVAKSIRAFCKDKIFNYFDLAAWASFTWLAGPYGRDYRIQTHECFELCIIWGEAVLYDTYWIDPRICVKHNRTPGSCSKCGLDSWCNDLTFMEGETVILCENCLNGGKRLFGEMGCGTKYCKYWECQYHPMHGKTMSSRYKILGENGQLLKQIGGNDASRHTTGKLFQNRPKLVAGPASSGSKEDSSAKLQLHNGTVGQKD